MKLTLKAKVWAGPVPAKCEAAPCVRAIDAVFVHGALRGRETMGWKIMCPGCARVQGVGLGHRKGVAYNRVATGHFVVERAAA